MEEAAAAGGRRTAGEAWGVLRPLLERFGVLVIFAGVIAVFSILSPDSFFRVSNFEIILRQTSTVILLGVGLTLVLAAGEFDLSFPYVFGLISGIIVTVMVDSGAGPFIGVLVGLLAGLAIGVINGALVATRRASSFIVTLAVGSVATGMMYGIAGESPVTFGLPEGYKEIARFELFGVRAVVMAALAAAVVVAVTLRSTVFGRYVRATGSNEVAAGNSGIPLALIRISVFAFLGLLVAVAAIFESSQANAHYPAAGVGLFLPPFVAAFLGTSVLARGQFNVFGTVIGALFISTLNTGLIIQNTPSWVISVVQGVVLLLAVMVAAKQGGLWKKK